MDFQNLLDPKNIQSGIGEKIWLAPVSWFAEGGVKTPNDGGVMIDEDYEFQIGFGFVEIQLAPRKNKYSAKSIGELGLNKLTLELEVFIPGSYAQLHEQANALMNVPLIVLCYDGACDVDFYYAIGCDGVAGYITFDFSTGVTNDGVKGYSGKVVTDKNSVWLYDGFIKILTGYFLGKEEDHNAGILTEDGQKIDLKFI